MSTTKSDIKSKNFLGRMTLDNFLTSCQLKGHIVLKNNNEG
jgi:hypothetical protein